MAFRDWLTSDGVFMPAYPWLSSAGDKFIEHGHRLLAMATGILTIAVVIVCFRCEPRRWVRFYSLGLLGGVLAQGVLGGMRVLLDERVLALLHGCIGPLFFAAAAGMAAVTSRRWAEAQPTNSANLVGNSVAGNRKLARLAVLTASLAYLQLVLGAIVRHSPFMLGDGAATIFQVAVYFHVLLAFAVTFHVLALAVRCVRGRLCVGSAIALGGLIVGQLLLGASSWIVKYGMPAWATQIIGETGHFNRESDLASATVLAAHGAVGALIVAGSVAIALHACRRISRTSSAAAASAPRLTGAPA